MRTDRHSGATEMPDTHTDNDEGAVAVIVALAMFAIIGIAALVVDAGSLYADRAKLQTAADAAALAGAQELYRSPGKAGVVDAVARHYVAINAPEAAEPDVKPWSSTGLEVPDTVRVTVAAPDSPLFFAPILNVFASDSNKISGNVARVAATATARVRSFAYAGVLPVGVISRDDSSPDFGFAGELQDLQLGLGAGNWGWMSLNWPPNPDPKYALDNKTMIGVFASEGTTWGVYLEEYGVNTGAKQDVMRFGFQEWWSPNKLGIVAVLDAPVDGRADSVKVIGFIEMRFEIQPEKGQIWAYYVRTLTEDDMVLTSYFPGALRHHVSLVQ